MWWSWLRVDGVTKWSRKSVRKRWPFKAFVLQVSWTIPWNQVCYFKISNQFWQNSGIAANVWFVVGQPSCCNQPLPVPTPTGGCITASKWIVSNYTTGDIPGLYMRMCIYIHTGLIPRLGAWMRSQALRSTNKKRGLWYPIDSDSVDCTALYGWITPILGYCCVGLKLRECVLYHTYGAHPTVGYHWLSWHTLSDPCLWVLPQLAVVVWSFWVCRQMALGLCCFCFFMSHQRRRFHSCWFNCYVLGWMLIRAWIPLSCRIDSLSNPILVS